MPRWPLIVCLTAGGVGLLWAGLLWAGESREEKVRGDRKRVEAQGWWIYNDLAQGLREAQASGKPLAVALRCIPCEECVKLDEELVDRDPRLRPLLEKFVRVRLISTNGLDLSTFQFDTDQSSLVFLMRADGTVYGRFGTRSDHKEWADDVSIEGLARALEGALELHAAWPRDQAALAAKRGPAPTFPTPETYPSLAAKYGPTLDVEGDPVRSCIHCHMIGEAERTHRREKEGALPEELLFSYPHPKSLGLVLDPKQRAAVKRVEPGSAAETAGFQPGDEVLTLEGQPLLSIADVQWVLHRTPAAGGRLAATVRRGAESRSLTLALPAGWRRADDLSWRASTWTLRQRGLGGMKLAALSGGERAKAGVPKAALGLRVEHVGQYAPHDRAKKAGVQKGDVLLSIDGRSDLPRETDVLRYALNDVAPGAELALELLRGRERLTLRVATSR